MDNFGVGLPSVPFSRNPVFWPICPTSRYNPGRDASCPVLGQPFVKQFSLCYQTVVCLSVCLSVCMSVCLSACLSVCDVGVLWRTVGWIKMKLGTQVGLDPGHIVLDGNPAPLHQKGHSPPILKPISAAAKWLDGSRCHLVGR